jgi:hypothetical protein
MDPGAGYLNCHDDQGANEPYRDAILDQGGGRAILPKATHEHLDQFPQGDLGEAIQQLRASDFGFAKDAAADVGR